MKTNVIGMNNGLMVYWEEVKGAAQYYVHLLISDWSEGEEKTQEIALVTIERNKKYHSFTDLARIDRRQVYSYDRGHYEEQTGRNYYIYVEAEDREGKIIDRCGKICCQVKEMRDGSAL